MLKQLIQRLLDSRTTPAQAAHSAMPSGNSSAVTNITPTKSTTDGWEKAASFVATADGYVRVQGTARNGDVCQLAAYNSNGVGIVIELLRANASTNLSIPVGKGSTVQVFGHYMTNIKIKFIGLIGGV